MTTETNPSTRCSTRVYAGTFSGHPCSKPGKMQHNGKWYCTIHNPLRIAERNAASNAKFEVEHKQRMQMHLDTTHKQVCFTSLLAALKAVMEDNCPLIGNPTHDELVEYWEREKTKGRGCADTYLTALHAIHNAENGPKA